MKTFRFHAFFYARYYSENYKIKSQLSVYQVTFR
jgi:hypothetical protein